MAFQPDILVTGPDGVSLVVEAKSAVGNIERTEEQLKQYMIGMQCPTGIVVTPDRMWVYRDRYTARSPQSIERVGEFDTTGLWQQSPPPDAALFEQFVQQWLERLAHQPIGDLPPNFGATLREYVVPALTDGDVRAAHPRSR